jgi:hypothetical protein
MRTSFRHQSEAQPPNGPLTAAASPDTPSYMASQPVSLQRHLQAGRVKCRRWREPRILSAGSPDGSAG